ncbi:MAG: multicomponent Na+:H+ antiporter subunit [Clostridia bacterium]|nr:multicomponent Na+:H+ antiporter subunit [Clostridia bacterium]
MRERYGTTILDTAIRLLVPFYLLYAVYVLVHGHYSPGGGFQAGVTLAASILLVNMVQGDEVTWGVNKQTAVILASIGTFIYAGIGILALFWGGNFLDYGVLPLGEIEPKVRALGTLGIETGVTLGVMGTFIVIFNLLTGREE